MWIGQIVQGRILAQGLSGSRNQSHPNVFDILVNFQWNVAGLTGNIERAFLIEGIKEEHRDILHFLWFENPSTPSSERVHVRFSCPVFGLRPSPSILGVSIKYHLRLYKQIIQADFFEKSLYVDDLFNRQRKC